MLSLVAWSTGSVERSVLNLCEGLNGRLLLPWCPAEKIDAEAMRWFGSMNGSLLVHPRHRIDRRGPERVLRLASVLHGQPERVVNLHHSTVSGASFSDVLACRLAGKRVVMTLHSPIENQPMSERIRRRVRRAARAADAVVVTSDFARDFVRKIVGELPRIEVIPLGLRARPQADGAALRAQLGIGSSDFVISHVARSNRGKGLVDVANAIVQAGLRERAWLLAGGDGPDHAQITAEARALIGERFLDQGWLADPDPTYAASDVFAMPSKVEAFGMVYLEAAVQGVPSLAYRTGGVTTAVADGRTGHLVTIGDIPALAAHLSQLFHNRGKCRVLGEAARQKTLDSFSVEVMSRSYSELFHELLGHVAAEPLSKGLVTETA